MNKNKDDPLIINNETVNDKNMKKYYFFFDKKRLGDDSDYLVDRWNNTSNDIEP